MSLVAPWDSCNHKPQMIYCVKKVISLVFIVILKSVTFGCTQYHAQGAGVVLGNDSIKSNAYL